MALHPGGRPVDPLLNDISNSTSMAAGANCEPQRQTTCLNCLAVVRGRVFFGGRASLSGGLASCLDYWAGPLFPVLAVTHSTSSRGTYRATSSSRPAIFMKQGGERRT